LVRTFALVVGIAFLALGLLGLILAPTRGLLLGTFAVDTLHNLVHLVVGALGLGAYYAGWNWSRLYSQGLGVVYIVIGLLGLIPPLVSGGALLGIMHINMADNLLHLVVGGIAAYIGFTARERGRVEEVFRRA
jgi:hypothetical protein